MKRYNDYMDGVEGPDTLREKLKHLEEPKKKPRPWAKWGGLAAALILAVGAGAWGLSRGGWNAGNADWGWDLPAISTVDVGQEIIPAPDIAFADPNDPNSDLDAPLFGGGYEVVDGEMAEYIFLPYLNWADAGQGTAMDYCLAPPSAVSRGAARDDVLAFAGGEKAMADHLLWDGLDWGGLFWFLEDGTPWAAALYADGHNLHFSLEVMKGGKVPSCIILPEDSYEYSTWRGVEITALKNGSYMVTDGAELNEYREVSFFCDGVGYKLTLYADDAARADELSARFVRYAVDGGFDLDVLSTGGVLDCSYYSVGEPDREDGASEANSGAESFYCDCPECIAGTVHTHPYDPSASDVDIVVTAPPRAPAG